MNYTPFPKFILVIGICLSALCIGGVCAQVMGDLPTYNEHDTATTAYLDKDSYFFVELPENPTTDYTWTLSVSDGLSILDTKFVAADNPLGLDGVRGTRVWCIKATKPGDQTIKGTHTSSSWWWSTTTATYSLKVHVSAPGS